MNVRLFASLTLLLPLWAWGQAVEDPISVTLRGARLEQLIPAMGRQMNRDLRVQDSLRDRVGLIRVNNIPSSELMTAVAAAFSAHWVDMGSYSILTRDGAKEEEMRRARLAFESENIRKQLERSLAKPVTAESLTEAVNLAVKLESEQAEEDEGYWQRQQQIEASSPAMRAASEFLQLIGPVTLAAMGNETRVVYATRPTAWQRPIPPWGAAWMARLNQRTGMWREVVNAVNAEQMVEDQWRSSLLRPPLPNRMVTAEAFVVVSRAPGTISVNVSGFNQTGERTVMGQAVLMTNTDVGFVDIDLSAIQRVAAEDLGAVELSAAQLRETQLLKACLGLEEQSAIPIKERLAGVLTWLDRDPAAGVLTDLILAYAQAKGHAQLVAAIPDIALTFLRTDEVAGSASGAKNEVTKVPVGSMIPAFHSVWGIWTVEKAGGATLYLARGAQAKRFLFDRRKAVQIAQRLQQRPVLTFEDLAEFVADAPDNTAAGTILSQAMSLSGQSAASDLFGGDQTTTLRLYGRMNASERRSARNGGLEVSLGSLRSPLKSVVDQMLFQSESWIEATIGPTEARPQFYQPDAQEELGETMTQEQLQRFQERVVEFQRKFYDGKYNEITFLMGAREAQPILVNLEAKREDVMIAFDPNASWGSTLRGSAGDVAHEVAQSEAFARAMPTEAGLQRNFQQFGVGQRETFTAAITFGKPAGRPSRSTMYGRVSHQINLMVSGEPIIGPYNSLPEAVRKDYEARLTEARKTYENMQFAPARGPRRIRP